MNILLTGDSGFVGHYIKQALLQTYKNGSCVPLADEKGAIDIRDAQRIKSFLSSNVKSFDAVLHLAAQSFVPESIGDPSGTYDINFTGVYNLFSALKGAEFHGKVLFVSSGDIYGLVGEDRLPVTEDEPLKPRNPYAVSKVAAEALCYQWSVTEDMEIITARPFNHIGPDQSERFVVPNFAKQIVEIELSLRKPALSAGNIDVTRDFLDVRDVVNAYMLLLEKGVNSEAYNVCSGTETSVRQVINTMLEITGAAAKIETDAGKLRPNEQKRVYGSFEKIKKITGWEPKIPLKQSLTDIINYQRKKLKGL
ncbi:MAG: GDP-mannose 4,6-dehydratase [bacterium]